MTDHPTKPHPGVLWADGDRPLFEAAQSIRSRTPGLKESDALVLLVLALDTFKKNTNRGTKVPAQLIAQWTGLDRSTVSKSITRLTGAGLLRRRGATGPLVIGRLSNPAAGAIEWHRSSFGHVARISALPSNWTTTIERTMLMLYAAAADPVGRYSFTTDGMKEIIGSRRATVIDSRVALRSWDGERPPLIEAESESTGPISTPYRLRLPPIPAGREGEPLDAFAHEWAHAELLREADDLADVVAHLDVLNVPPWSSAKPPATGTYRSHEAPPATGTPTGTPTGTDRSRSPVRIGHTTLYYPPPHPYPARIRARAPVELTTPLALAALRRTLEGLPKFTDETLTGYARALAQRSDLAALVTDRYAGASAPSAFAGALAVMTHDAARIRARVPEPHVHRDIQRAFRGR